MFGCVGGDIAHLHRNVDHEFGLADAAGGTESYSEPPRRALAAAGKFRAVGSALAWLEASAATVPPRLRLRELVAAGRACGWARGRL